MWADRQTQDLLDPWPTLILLLSITLVVDRGLAKVLTSPITSPTEAAKGLDASRNASISSKEFRAHVFREARANANIIDKIVSESHSNLLTLQLVKTDRDEMILWTMSSRLALFSQERNAGPKLATLFSRLDTDTLVDVNGQGRAYFKRQWRAVNRVGNFTGGQKKIAGVEDCVEGKVLLADGTQFENTVMIDADGKLIFEREQQLHCVQPPSTPSVMRLFVYHVDPKP